MNIELAKLPNGDLAIVCDTEFEKPVRRVEYYRDQRLFMLIYDDPDHEGDLLEHEISEESAQIVKNSANDIVIFEAPDPSNPKHYKVPLIQIGI